TVLYGKCGTNCDCASKDNAKA
ncbi:TPA: GapA-binding peptide SR1P, partial [Bacillus cereus]|nr:GapA-binding peptide SR1P [Bacillus anthracis]